MCNFANQIITSQTVIFNICLKRNYKLVQFTNNIENASITERDKRKVRENIKESFYLKYLLICVSSYAFLILWQLNIHLL